MLFERPLSSQSETENLRLGTLASGEEVFLTPTGHYHDNPELMALLPEALEKVTAQDRTFIKESLDLGRVIGVSRCIPTLDSDEIVYAQRVGRAGLTRFVKNRAPIETNFLTLILKKKKEAYEVVTTFIGPAAEREPWDKNIKTEAEKTAAENFWFNHALVWGTEPVVAGTEQKR